MNSQSGSPFLATGVKVYTIRHSKMNVYNAMFIITILNLENYRYNYGNARILNKIQREKIKLPVANGGKYFSGDISSILINQLTNGNAPLNTEKKRQLDEELVITKREKEILQLLLSGKGNKEIAEALEISKRTAEVHRFNLMKKLKVKNLIELANKAKEYSLL
jgi:DNA-binding CsgD family transcriptional regulator